MQAASPNRPRVADRRPRPWILVLIGTIALSAGAGCDLGSREQLAGDSMAEKNTIRSYPPCCPRP